MLALAELRKDDDLRASERIDAARLGSALSSRIVDDLETLTLGGTYEPAEVLFCLARTAALADTGDAS